MGSFLDISQLSFLVADDSRFMRRLVVSSLKAFGARKILEARNGEEAYALIEMGQSDIALLDWEFPGRSGESIMQSIRTPGHAAAYQTVIMMSGYDERTRIERALKFGVNGYVAKPVAPATLYAQIRYAVLHPRPYLRTQTYLGPEHPLIIKDIEDAQKRVPPSPETALEKSLDSSTQDDLVELDL